MLFETTDSKDTLNLGYQLGFSFVIYCYSAICMIVYLFMCFFSGGGGGGGGGEAGEVFLLNNN